LSTKIEIVILLTRRKEVKVKEKAYINTTIDKKLLTELKLLAVKQGKRQNELLEEAIKLLLEKYKNEKKSI
jgi:metal-responsive CopG/Arc/MetJ family transcriptional regulator